MAANYTPVSLMGPVAGQPVDYATQQAQLQNAMQIAMSLIGKSQATPEPTINPSPGNPYARVVPNIGGMISQIASGVAGQSQLADVNAKQQDLANKIMQNRIEGYRGLSAPVQEGVKSFDIPSPLLTPETQDQIAATGGTLTDAHTLQTPGYQRPPTMDEMRTRAWTSTDPLIQAIGGTILARQGDLAGKMAQTPEATAAMVKAGILPQSIAASIKPNSWGFPQVDPAGLRLTGKEYTKTPDQEVGTIDLNPGGGPTVKVPADPTYKINQEQATEALKPEGPLAAGRATAIANINTLPVLGQMLNMVEKANTGGTFADALTEMRQVAKALNISDQIQWDKITDLQTLDAFGVMPAINVAKKLNSTRATQQEFNTAQRAVGTSSKLQPESAVRVLNEQVANTLNNIEEYKASLKPYEQNPFLKAKLPVYADNLDTTKHLGNLAGTLTSDNLSLMRVGEDPESGQGGTWVSNGEALTKRDARKVMSVGGPQAARFKGTNDAGVAIYSQDGQNWFDAKGNPWKP
jgi:hypothetical protein